MPSSGLNLAVIGSGVAGLTASYILQRSHRVTLYEKNEYVGGHTHTIELPDGADRGTPVDTGFIVMNHRNYPLFTRLLEQLDIGLKDSDMSFSYHDHGTGLQYSGSDLNGLFAQRKNLLRPSYYRFIAEILRFFREAKDDLESGRLDGLTLGHYLERGRFSDMFIDHHIIPMGAAIWSTPCSRMLEFPAQNFARFFSNHGLLGIRDRPQWKTVAGGSRSYVRKILAGFKGKVRLGNAARAISREAHRVKVVDGDGIGREYDAVVLATHADQALALLNDPSHRERELLGAWTYSRNPTFLHTDVSLMPSLERAWASWNYIRPADTPRDTPVTLTYDMNRLQRLQTVDRYFVSLNPAAEIAQDKTIASMVYEHPTYTQTSLASQKELCSLNGDRNTYFCGSYFGYGFHEDAVRSAVQVAGQFGLEL
jgi:predicted NAD/FAD-binding protein